MIRNIFGLFSCKNQGKNGYFPVMYSNKRTGYAKDKNLRNSKKKKKEIAVIIRQSLCTIRSTTQKKLM